jgi:hypothetical protein
VDLIAELKAQMHCALLIFRGLFMAANLGKFFTAALLFGICLLAGPSLADTREDIRSAYIEAAEKTVGAATAAQFFAQMLQRFDRNLDGITKDEIDSAERIQSAAYRGNFAGINLQNDLDGDFRVTRAEIEEVAKNQTGPFNAPQKTERGKKHAQVFLDAHVEQFMKADIDKNGVIEGSEIYAAPYGIGAEGEAYALRVKFFRILLNADPNADGRLTEDETTFLREQYLSGIDAELAKKKSG